ncbi:hypothetical protein E2C01_018879 [Portunus trituberculatus]|uniref:Uncharacterized protein n=1 Tax=Portunus trituberculatus TaxID=210409 RepID=A0A5B7DXK1_PORTR|nr:hypothetical protein [Portunus trituberculatus]
MALCHLPTIRRPFDLPHPRTTRHDSLSDSPQLPGTNTPRATTRESGVERARAATKRVGRGGGELLYSSNLRVSMNAGEITQAITFPAPPRSLATVSLATRHDTTLATTRTTQPRHNYHKHHLSHDSPPTNRSAEPKTPCHFPAYTTAF